MSTVSYLLDTHALLWALTDPEQLGPQAGEIVSDARSVLGVSAASAWEVATKHRRGKLPHGDVLVAGYQRNLARLGATEVPVTSEHALLAGGLQWEHRDPFDRMIAAQAMVESLTILTKDAALSGLAGVRTVW